MNQPMLQPQQTLYQADPALSKHVKDVQDKLFNLCHDHVTRPVRVQMMNGQVHEGVIVQVDEGHLYLHVSSSNDRAFGGPWAPNPWVQPNVILPLVLYNLLVISLL
ncbi:hypothetical protein ABE504_25015 [Paenibacillus oryzisoli]|uniref:hypothetical protein n=1 Tax=Paenibacillus oryzisoli TaxID=1850517 RepID=UPI003D269353